MINPLEEKLARNSLLGLNVTIIKSSNPQHLMVKGLVVDETKNMLIIANDSGKKRISKENVTYGFTQSDGTFIEINGRQLLGRLVDRIGKILGRRQW